MHLYHKFWATELYKYFLPCIYLSTSISTSHHPYFLTTTVDYAGPTVTELMFNANTLLQCFTLPIVDDSLLEGVETFSVALVPSNPSLELTGAGNVTVMQITAMVEIIDDDSEFYT